MAKPERVAYFRIRIEDKPGALLAIARELREKNVGLIGCSGVSSQPGRSELFVIPKKPDRLRTVWKASGRDYEEGTGFLVKGRDVTGALITTLEALSRQGINIIAGEAVAIGGKYGAFIWVAPEDVEKTAKTLGVP